MSSSQIVRFFVAHALIGYGIAAVFVAILLWFDVAGLGTLVWNSDVGWLAVLMLVLFLGQSFAGLQIGFAVWFTARDPADEDDDDGPSGPFLPEPLDAVLLAPARAWNRKGRR